MCVAVPMKVTHVDAFTCVAEIDGVTKTASLLGIDGVEVGDYIMVHAGLAIAKLDTETAEETLRLMREIVAMEEEEDDGMA